MAESEELRHELRAVCAGLWKVAPSVRNVSPRLSLVSRPLKIRQEYIRLLKLDATIFDKLVGDFVNPQSGETEELDASQQAG